MKLFISWSGERSRFVAAALRTWLKMFLQAVDPWMSETEAVDGQRWNPDVESELYKAAFGISCVTGENRNTPWLLFEAGALAAQVKVNEFLCGYLIDIKASDLDYPLAQFRATTWDREGTLELVRAVNSALKELEPKSALDDSLLESLFGLLWPDLERKFAQAPKEHVVLPEKIETADTSSRALSELLAETRGLARQVERIEQRLQENSTAHPPNGLAVLEVAPLVTEMAPRPDSIKEKSAAKRPGKIVQPEPAERRDLKCPSCGETENLRTRTRTREYSPKIDHHDLFCENCKVVLRQFHTFKGDEQQKRLPCPKECPFWLSRNEVRTLRALS